jgi:ABC-type tungstate transport system substrate-binding protein
MPDLDPDDVRPTDRQPLLDLSLPQLVAGATAAATSAILISRLGLLGTVLGAAFASVVSAVVTAGLVGGWHRVRTVPSRFPRNVNGMVVTAVALGLVVVAFQAGIDLVTRDLPPDTFAGRWLAQVGLSRG